MCAMSIALTFWQSCIPAEDMMLVIGDEGVTEIFANLCHVYSTKNMVKGRTYFVEKY